MNINTKEARMITDCKVGEARALFADLDKPSLHALSYALRHPDTWPEGFVWDYGCCDTCAMGLAHALWRRQIHRASNESGASIMARSFAMPYATALEIFMGRGDWMPEMEIVETRFFGLIRETYVESDYSAVTPEMVADRIDAYLAQCE